MLPNEKIAEESKGGFSFALNDQVILFSSVRLSSPSGFIVASLITCTICILERALTFVLSTHYYPQRLKLHESRIKLALWRTSLYWIATILRLLYMLVAMSFNAGLLIVMVSALALGQFIIEYIEAPELPANATSHIRVKSSNYSPIPTYPPLHHSLQTPSPYVDDVELATTPPPSHNGLWLNGTTSNRDKSQQGISTSGDSAARHSQEPSGSRLAGGSGPASRIAGSVSRINTSSIHGKDPLSPIRSGSSAFENSISSAKRALFQIGDEEEDRSESD